MTRGLKGLEDALGLPSLADALAQNQIEVESLPDPYDVGEPIEQPAQRGSEPEAMPLPGFSGMIDHGRSMDLIFQETLKLARDVADTGFQVDTPRMARFFEVANSLYATAKDAADTKLEAQFKTIKMQLEVKKLEIAERAANGTGSPQAAARSNGAIVIDRNEIIAQYLANSKNDDPSTKK